MSGGNTLDSQDRCQVEGYACTISPFSIRHRRVQAWHEAGVIKDLSRAILSEPDHDGILDWEEAFVDATFVRAKKGAQRSERQREGKERSTW